MSENIVQVCPICGYPKDRKIESYKKEQENFIQEKIYPFSQYAKEYYPDICIGNCESCQNYESITEKEYWKKENSTTKNKIFHAIRRFMSKLFLGAFIGCPIAAMVASFTGGFTESYIAMITFIPFGFAMILEIAGFPTSFDESFNDWLEEKWKEHCE